VQNDEGKMRVGRRRRKKGRKRRTNVLEPFQPHSLGHFLLTFSQQLHFAVSEQNLGQGCQDRG
jgi:hypothetical protein